MIFETLFCRKAGMEVGVGEEMEAVGEMIRGGTTNPHEERASSP